MSSFPTFTFGALLRRYRLRAGLTQAALAEQARLSIEAISTLERGTRRAPRQETLDLLAEALGLGSAERAHFQQVARGQGAPPTAAASLPRLALSRERLLPMAGRQPEMARLAQHLEGSGPPLLLFAGEPGIGKSRLLAEARQRARAQGWTVLEGGCHRRSGQEPFTPLLTALEGYLRRTAPAALRSQLEGCAWLARLLPELAATTLVPAPSWNLPPEQERRLMFAAVGRFLANIAGPAGTVLLLDDLQWAGADALDLLAALLRSPAPLPLRIISAYRSTDVHPPDVLSDLVADLAVGGLAAQHQLKPLAPQEAAVLLNSLLEEGEEADVERSAHILARTGGVPFFLVSCAQALKTGAPEIRGADVPWNVAQSIRQRVAALPEGAQELLGTAAVIGREAPTALLLALAPHTEAGTLVSLKVLGQTHLLVEEGEATSRFTHDLIREVVLADLSPAERRFMHRQVAQALEQEPGEVALQLLAHHYVRAGVDERAVIYLERAGDQALAVHAPAEAERCYRDLVTHLGRLNRPLDMARACEKLGKLLGRTAHQEEALEVLTQAEAIYRTAGDQEWHWLVIAQIGHIHAEHGTAVEGLRRLLPLLESPGPGASPQVLTEVYGAVAHLHFSLVRYPESLAAREQALKWARLTQDDVLLVAALAGYAKALFGLSLHEQSRQVTEEVLPLAERLKDLWLVSDALGKLAWYSSRIQGAFAQSRAYQDQALELSERLGDPFLLYYHLRQRALLNFLNGDWQAARQDSERARRLHPWRGEQNTTCFPLLDLGQVSLAQGQWAEARQLLEEGIAVAERTQNLNGQGIGHARLAEWDLLNGRPQAARARLEPFQARAVQGEFDLTMVLPPLAWAAILLEDRQAEFLVEQALIQAQQMRIRMPDALNIQALLCIRQQRWDEAQAALEEALALCRAMPYPYAEAKALYVYGLLHQAKGEPEQARARLEAALTILNQLGERLYAEQVERALAEGKGP